MKTGRYFVLTIIAIAFFSCKRKPTLPERQSFEQQIVRILNLKLIYKDSDYQFSRLIIFNDTIVGFWDKTINGKEYKSYFIQSIINPSDKIEFNNFSLVYPSISPVEYYRNGRIYFGKFGGSTMQTLDTAGILAEYFQKYKDTLFYTNKIMVDKEKAILTSMNGVYVFDINSQRLIWKYAFKEAPMEGLSAVIGGNLIFTETVKGHSNVFCYDLVNSRLKWNNQIENDADYLYDQEYLPHHHLYHDENNVIIPEINACYSLNLNTGRIINKVPWKGFFTQMNHDPRFTVENHILYVNNYNDSTDLRCIDMVNDKNLWHLKNAYFWGLYKNYVIAFTSSMDYMLVINKQNGRVMFKIHYPKTRKVEFDFIDKYILINHFSLYQ